VRELGKPSAFITIHYGLRPITISKEVTYKNFKIRNCYIELRVEERLKSERRSVIDLIKSFDSIREDADLDIVVIVITSKLKQNLIQPGFKHHS